MLIIRLDPNPEFLPTSQASRDGRNPVAARDVADSGMKNVRVLSSFQLIRD
jgi:hypothetical protein